ncbi:MAG: nucleoside monophosphate kinase [Candidatus Omnitrophica bacterium]|nr:nucleoside monophosphate kinase [Candidatus Omnitrophota bacterium]
MKAIIFGSPGSGKGTQAVILSEYLKLKKISLGDILREEVKKESDLGKEVKSFVEKGILVSDELVSRVIEENIKIDNFLLDGYPRNLKQAQHLEKTLEKNDKKLDFLIYLDIDEKAVEDRLSQRRVCKLCGANFHLENMPSKEEGVCDICDGELIQRKDDTPEVIKKRWEIFSNESKSILEFYTGKLKIIKVNANEDKDSIFSDIKEQLQ